MKTDAEKLEEAEAALHALLTGKSASVFVDQIGERIQYARTSIDRLRGYLAHLRSILGEPGRSPHTIRFQTSKGL